MLRAAPRPQSFGTIHTCHPMVLNEKLFLNLYQVITCSLSQVDLFLTKYITAIQFLQEWKRFLLGLNNTVLYLHLKIFEDMMI